MQESDFFGRLRGFVETFGAGGVLVIIIAALIITTIAMWRGTGFLFLILFISFSLGAINQGGVVFMATLTRWGCLFLLGVGLFKRPQFHSRAMLFFAFYVLLCIVFMFLSPVFMFSVQQTGLLVMTVLGVSLAINSYITSPKDISTLFKMGIVAAAIWTATSITFLSAYRYSATLRFSTSAEVGGVAAAYAGVFFAPMVMWGIIQNRYILWRIFCVILFVPYALMIVVGGVRSAILGMLVIASLPVLLSKVKLIRIIITACVLWALVAITLKMMFLLNPAKAQYLVERITSTSTTGRFEIWASALLLCIQSGLLGHGVAASGVALSSGKYFHNAYLIIWYDAGLIGLILVLLFLANYVLKSLRLIFGTQTQEITEYSLVALGYMLGMIIMGMFEGIFATAGGIGLVMLMIFSNMIDHLRYFRDVELSYYSLPENDEGTNENDETEHLTGY
jgi:O-antigen ligase